MEPNDYSSDYGFMPSGGAGKAIEQQDYSSDYGFSPSNPSSPTPSASPTDQSSAMSVISNAEKEMGSQDYNGWCEMWQEQMTGSPNMGGSAAEAWNNYASQGRAYQGLQGVQPGNKIYFSGDRGLGHTGIITNVDPKSGDATFISATDNGVQENQVSSWLQENPDQSVLGFVK